MASIRDWKNGSRDTGGSQTCDGLGKAYAVIDTFEAPPTREEWERSREAMLRTRDELAERLGWNLNPEWRQKRPARKTEAAPLSPDEREQRREMIRRQAEALGATVDTALAVRQETQ